MVKQKQIKGTFLDPKADLVFKKIFGQHPDLIKSFLNNLLPLPENRTIESIEYLPSEQVPRIPTMKHTIVDVKCTDQDGRIFIVEMQMAWNPYFYQRFLYGTSRAYVQQLKAGEFYEELCPVYGVALINEIFEKESPDWFHHYRFTNTKDIDKALEGIELVFVELPKFTPQTFEHRRMGVLWLRFLREASGLTDIPEEFRESPEILKALELAQESAYTKEELNVYDVYLDAIRVDHAIRYDAQQKVEQARQESAKQLEQAKQESAKQLEQAKQESAKQLEQAKQESAKQLEQAKQESAKQLEQAKWDMAHKMLDMGMDIGSVRDLTGLSLEAIESLRS